MESMIAAVCLMIFWLGIELSGRKKVGLKPSGVGDVFSLLVSRGEFADQEGRRAFVFALFCTLCFAFWEAFLWLLFGRQGSMILQVLSLVGIFFLVKGLFTRFRRFYWMDEAAPEKIVQGNFILILLGFGLLLGAWVTLVLLAPWVLFRFKRRHQKLQRQNSDAQK